MLQRTRHDSDKTETLFYLRRIAIEPSKTKKVLGLSKKVNGSIFYLHSARFSHTLSSFGANPVRFACSSLFVRTRFAGNAVALSFCLFGSIFLSRSFLSLVIVFPLPLFHFVQSLLSFPSFHFGVRFFTALFGHYI